MLLELSGACSGAMYSGLALHNRAIGTQKSALLQLLVAVSYLFAAALLKFHPHRKMLDRYSKMTLGPCQMYNLRPKHANHTSSGPCLQSSRGTGRGQTV